MTSSLPINLQIVNLGFSKDTIPNKEKIIKIRVVSHLVANFLLGLIFRLTYSHMGTNLLCLHSTACPIHSSPYERKFYGKADRKRPCG